MTSVSLVIPCRNEEKHIVSCLDSIVKQSIPQSLLEVLIVDGMSEDKTRDIVSAYAKEYHFIKILDNLKKNTPAALNLGISAAKGDIITITGAHSQLDKDFITNSVKALEKYSVDCVGGVSVAKPTGRSLFSKAIATVVLNHRGKNRDVVAKDTVPRPSYRREVFDKVGLFNEQLLRSQDMEFNLRLLRHGGEILCVPNIVGHYYAKPNLWAFFKHAFKDGIWAIYPWKYTKKLFRARHYIPFILVATLLVSLIMGWWLPFIAYVVLLLYLSFPLTYQSKDWRLFFVSPIVFAAHHIGYGVGSTWGILKLIIGK